MNSVVEEHLGRVTTAVLRKFTASSIAKWVAEKTTYAGQPYSYKDHEYQERILGDTSTGVNIRKCSQVGLSEASSRMSLALVNVLSPYTLCYTLPTAHFAGAFAKTRMDPIIQGSKAMKQAVHKTNDNNEVKQFGDSFIWIKGAASSNAPISIPCDHLVHDEVDFSDQEVLGQYVSRLTHSKWKRYHRLSTPTLPGFGIDKYFRESRRFFNFVKCHHCNHQFVPDYYRDVKIPGFTKDLREVTKSIVGKIAVETAQVVCPRCGLIPSLQVEHREWVCENPSETFVDAGYQVTPFDAPNIIAPGYLVQASTRYDRVQDFVNFGLGLPMEDTEATLTPEDLARAYSRGQDLGGVVYVMGVDVGNIYHMVVAAVNGYGEMGVVHTEQVGMGKAKERYHELRRLYNVACTVIDSGPHAETVMAIQEVDPNCYAAVYTRSKSILTHKVVDKEEEKEKGQEFLRQVNVNRNRAFDGYMNAMREGEIQIVDSAERETVTAHHISMKRVKVFDAESQEMSFSWQKSDGIDHYHHAFLYTWIASRIKGVGRPMIILPTTLVSSFRLKQK